MSDSIEITYADNLEALTKALEGLERPGDYFASGTLECAPPLMEVKGVGVVSFPVPDEQAQSLAQAAILAPYGRGDQTLVDESVRKVRQIAPKGVRLAGKQWTATLKSIVDAATLGLGRPKGSLEAEFYKLLIYEEGGFFLAHRDTEKAPGMLGTLIIVLPSAHEGGELVVRHDGRETVLDLRNFDPGELRYAAFYADCEHEVRPVTQGHRVCLVYNLITAADKDAERLSVPDLRPNIDAAAEALSTWIKRTDRSEKLVYLLEHRYTQAAIAFSALKGPDAVCAEVLRFAAEKAGCTIHLAMIHIEESGWAEWNGDFNSYGRGRRYWDEDEEEEEDEDDFEIGEVCDEERYIDQWRDIHDQSINYGKIPLADGEVLPVGALDDEEADETHFSEATGNEGASFERTYLRAALVLWPSDGVDVIIASAGLEAALTLIEQRVEEVCKGDPSGTAAESVHKLMKLIASQWSEYTYSLPDKATERLIATLVRFGDSKLLRERMLPLLQMHLPKDCAPLIDWARLSGPKGFQRVAEEILSPEAKSTAVFSLHLWTGCAEVWSDSRSAKPVLHALLDPLFAKLGNTEYRSVDDGVDDYFAYRRARQQIRVFCPPELCSRFLLAIDGLGDAARTSALNAIRKHASTFSLLNTLIPALESAGSGHALPTWAAEPLWRYAAEELLGHAAEPPPDPTDWTQPLTPEQRTQLPANLREFALDPNCKVLRLPLRKELRQKIHQIIDRLSVDMTHVTERKGRPYALVCTKTLGHYKRASGCYQQDYDGLCRLASAPQALANDGNDLSIRLAKAIDAGKGWKPKTASQLKLPRS